MDARLFTERFVRELGSAGLDLVHPFSPRAINAAAEARYHLPLFGRPDALAFLIGNTRELWPLFLKNKREGADPLDRYVEENTQRALASTGQLPHWIRFAHDYDPMPYPFQALCAASGFAARGPIGLNVHPTYGPWFGLRAAVVLDLEPVGPSGLNANPCAGCAQPCTNAEGITEAPVRVEPALVPLLTARLRCPVGSEYRYGTAQLGYHYTKGAEFLRSTASE